jgi:hypothetical protein
MDLKELLFLALLQATNLAVYQKGVHVAHIVYNRYLVIS